MNHASRLLNLWSRRLGFVHDWLGVAGAVGVVGVGVGVGVAITQHCRPQRIIGTQMSNILDVTRTRLPDHAARVSASRFWRMPSTP